MTYALEMKYWYHSHLLTHWDRDKIAIVFKYIFFAFFKSLFDPNFTVDVAVPRDINEIDMIFLKGLYGKETI